MVFDYMDHDLTGLMDRLGHNLPVTEVCVPSHPCARSDHPQLPGTTLLKIRTASSELAAELPLSCLQQ